MSADYWLGVATVPTVVVLAVLGFRAWVRLVIALRHRGFTFDLKLSRDINGISDYTLRNSVWWERSFGPIFIGGWYREPPTYNRPRINRWVGIGRADGPCFMAFRIRHLKELHPATKENR